MRFEPRSGDAGKRLDHYLAEQLPGYSRARVQAWIRDGLVQVEGGKPKASYTVRGGERIEVQPAELPPLRATPEDIPLDILYEDASVIAVNKPAGMAVHAGAGRTSGTLVNALLHRFDRLSSGSGEERPGIVHRLDKETSGVLLIARTDEAHRNLSAQFSSRKVEKMYNALVEGQVQRDEGRIESRITRDPHRRVRMTARLEYGRNALTDYRVLERFGEYTYLAVSIHTGRTHQIRVHLSSIGHPVAGDRLYGAAAGTRGRFFLHARVIVFDSPATGMRTAIEAPLPPELGAWLQSVREV